MKSGFAAIITLLVVCTACSPNNKDEKRMNVTPKTETDYITTAVEGSTKSQVSNILEETALISENTSSVTKPSVEERLAHEGLPLTGDNIFDPKEINIGNTLVNFKLLSIDYKEGTTDYFYDTVVAMFEGEVILNGSVCHTCADDAYYPEQYVFVTDAESTLLLPVSHHDSKIAQTEITNLLISNQEDAEKSFLLPSGSVIENVRVRIGNYRYVYMASEELSSAKLIEIID